jgi:L-arabinose isomerase
VIVNFGLVDSPERALQVGHLARTSDIDLLVIYVTTYALSSTVLPVVRTAKVPVLVLNLQPTSAIDYARFNALQDRTAMTGEWLAYCAACPVPEIANVFQRAGVPFRQVTGVLDDDPQTWQQINSWMQAAQVAKELSHSRVGLMGHYYNGMLDIATDLVCISAIFGSHLEIIEVDELSQLRSEVTDAAIDQKLKTFRDFFDIQQDCSEQELGRAARTSAALDRLAETHQLSALAYYYKGSGVEANADTLSSIILGASLLTSKGLPVAGEYEVKNVIAMKILNGFGAGGSFTEYYAIDFVDDVVLMGHDGPGHSGIAQGRTKVKPLQVYHGKVGQGLSVEMSVKHGPVTLLSVVESATHGYKLLIAEAVSEPGPILEIGNTNSRYRFPIGARGFVNAWNQQGPAHHCAIGMGHIADSLQKLASLLGIEAVQVC